MSSNLPTGNLKSSAHVKYAAWLISWWKMQWNFLSFNRIRQSDWESFPGNTHLIILHLHIHFKICLQWNNQHNYCLTLKLFCGHWTLKTLMEAASIQPSGTLINYVPQSSQDLREQEASLRHEAQGEKWGDHDALACPMASCFCRISDVHNFWYWLPLLGTLSFTEFGFQTWNKPTPWSHRMSWQLSSHQIERCSCGGIAFPWFHFTCYLQKERWSDSWLGGGMRWGLSVKMEMKNALDKWWMTSQETCNWSSDLWTGQQPKPRCQRWPRRQGLLMWSVGTATSPSQGWKWSHSLFLLQSPSHGHAACPLDVWESVSSTVLQPFQNQSS